MSYVSDLRHTKAPGAVARPALEVRNLSVQFVTRATIVHAVKDVSFDLAPGKVLCVVGESGSGKSVMMRSFMRLLPTRRTRISGQVRIDGSDVFSLKDKELERLRGNRIAMIFQDPMSALDPVYTVGDQIAEALMCHRPVSRKAARQEALKLLEAVRIPSPEQRMKAYPHELSGGLRQRAMIAMALSCEPDILLADEPTTALDATVQIQILLLLRQIQRASGMAMIFVTHDLGVAAQIADEVAVMYAGRIVEHGTAQDVLLRAQHPYTQRLLSSLLRNDNGDYSNTTVAAEQTLSAMKESS